MHIVGFDLGKRNSQLCIGQPDGIILRQVRVPTTRAGISLALAPYGPCQVLLEASTSSEWVARHLEAEGHDVVVGDPRFGPMYAQRDKAIKTDKRDAAALFHARRFGAFSPAHRRGDDSRHLRQKLLARTSLVRMRAKIAVEVRAALELDGIRLKPCAIENLPDRLQEVTVSDETGLLLLPLMTVFKTLGEEIEALDKLLDQVARANPVAERFDRVVGIGPITALAVVACIGDPKRFSSAREVSSYVGLVPREYSSGEGRRQGGITKAGDSLTRSYIVQAAWRILRSKSDEVAPLREWALRVAERRGRKRAVVALGRCLVRILFAMWRDGRSFEPARLMSI
jgi:transposase